MNSFGTETLPSDEEMLDLLADGDDDIRQVLTLVHRYGEERAQGSTGGYESEASVAALRALAAHLKARLRQG